MLAADWTYSQTIIFPVHFLFQVDLYSNVYGVHVIREGGQEWTSRSDQQVMENTLEMTNPLMHPTFSFKDYSGGLARVSSYPDTIWDHPCASAHSDDYFIQIDGRI